MNEFLDDGPPSGLERSCGPCAGDWIRHAPAQPGLERIDAYFGGHAYDPHRHDTYGIGCTLSGVQSFDYRGARADSTTGQVIVLHPDERHDGRAGAETGFRYRMIYVEPRLVRDALDGEAHALPFARSAVCNDPALRHAVAQAFVDPDRELEALARDEIVLSIARALLALDGGAARRPGRATSSAAVERARQFLDAEFERVVSSEELERVSGLDRYALARHFRARLGTSPYRYLTMRRLGHARRSLLEGQSLAEAALASGFADQSHMTRRFKQAYGLTPGQWRALSVGSPDGP